MRFEQACSCRQQLALCGTAIAWHNSKRAVHGSVAGIAAARPACLRSAPALQALEELIAADNKLESLPDGLFQALRNLRTVVLYGNALRGLPAGPFLSANLKGKCCIIAQASAQCKRARASQSVLPCGTHKLKILLREAAC